MGFPRKNFDSGVWWVNTQLNFGVGLGSTLEVHMWYKNAKFFSLPSLKFLVDLYHL